MAAPYHKIIVYPSNIEFFTITMSGNSLTKSDFTRDATNDRFYRNEDCDWLSGDTGTASQYPSPKIYSKYVDNTGAIVIDFRPEHLYAFGDETILTDGYIYVDNLNNPTALYNNKGWASLNAFDWSINQYSNFRTITFNSTTNKYDIDCTECVGFPEIEDPVIVE